MHSFSQKAAAATLIAVLLCGFFALLFPLGSFYWFHGDEWVLLTQRQSGSILLPHNEHLTALAITVFRVLLNTVSLSDYTFYQVPVVLAHLFTCAMLWLVMRRCAVNAWIATSLAAVFVFFSPGEENILWAMQVGFTGALGLGIAQMLLADHGGKISWRDVLGLLVGFVALVSAGFTPVIVAATGLVVLVRRGLPAALFHTAPLAMFFLGWWFIIGPESISDPHGRDTDPAAVAHFVFVGFRAAFLGLAVIPPLAVAYLGVLVVGLLVALGTQPRGTALQRCIMPLALLLAGTAFMAVAGLSRWWINDEAGAQSRYVHITAALAIPAMGVALHALTNRHRLLVAAACLLLLSAIPGNISSFGEHPVFNEKRFERKKLDLVSFAHSPYAGMVPPATRPDPVQIPVSIGWILERRDEGGLPDIEPKPHRKIHKLQFGLSQIDAPNPFHYCISVSEPLDLSLRRGDQLGVEVSKSSTHVSGWWSSQSFTVQLLENGKAVGHAKVRIPTSGNLLNVEIDELEVRFDVTANTESFLLCGPQSFEQ